MIGKILNSVEDISECIRDGTLKVCFLHPNTKVSLEGWNRFVTIDELDSPSNAEYNLGISLIEQEYPGAPILTCIDVDGDKSGTEQMAQATKDWFYEIIINKLNELQIKFMSIKSSSGGYHIYVYTREESNRYQSTTGLIYPKSAEEAGKTDNLKFLLSGYNYALKDLYQEELPKSVVEIWCQKRYMVAPGSDIYDDDGNYVGTTHLLTDGVQTFKEIGIYEDSLNDLIHEAFLDAGFNENKNNLYSPSKLYKMVGSSQYLEPQDIVRIGDFIVEYLPFLHGQKHRFTLAFGGFLKQKEIHIDSINDLADYVIENTPADFFKSDEQFRRTLCHDTVEADDFKPQTGLPTIEEMLEPYCSKEIIGKKLHLLTNPMYHKFWPNGRYAKQYTEIIINFVQNYMVKNQIQAKINDGELVETVTKNSRVSHNINRINFVDDISTKYVHNEWEKPVQVTFSTHYKTIKSPIYENCEELFSGYRKMRGAHGDYTKDIIEHIYNEFEALNLIDTVESSTRPGIWMSRKYEKLIKYILEDDKIVQLEPVCPPAEDLKNGLQLLLKIKDNFPWKGDKFAIAFRMGLTMPYSYIMKSEYGTLHPSLILHGESGALKTSFGELLVYMNGDFTVDKKKYIVSGGELYSEFRFGKNMDYSSFPLIVNEPEQLFREKVLAELIKDSVTGDLIREPGGKGGRAYYSHRCAVYTMNALPSVAEDDAFLRRFVTIFFDRDERGDVPEVLERLQFLNVGGRINYRFRELSVIGDYVYHIVNKNLNWLGLSVEEFQNKIIDSMEASTGLDLKPLKTTFNLSLAEREDQESYTLNLILKVLKGPYLRNRNKFIKDRSDKVIVKELIKSNSEYSYIHMVRSRDDDEYILLDIGLKDKYNERYGFDHKNITLPGIRSYLLDLDIDFTVLEIAPCYVVGMKKQIRGIKLTLDDFVKILTSKENI